MIHQENKDSIPGTIVAGVKPYAGCLRGVLDIAVIPLIFQTKQSNKDIGVKDFMDNLSSAVFVGWLRTLFAIAISGMSNNPISQLATIYFAADTMAVSLRRIGWGRIHDAYKK